MRVLVIDNLKSGQGDAGLYAFVRQLVAAGADVDVRPFEGGDVAPLLDGHGAYDRVVAGGGDGTVSSVAYALKGTGVPILAYPGGTANLLALNLGLPHDPAALARATLAGKALCTDLGEIEVTGAPPFGFAIMAGAGFDAKVMEGASELKPTLGVGAYLLSVMRNLTPTVADFRVWLDGELLATDGIAVILVNFAKIQFDLAVTHDSVADDGLLEVVVIRTRNVAGLIPTVWQALLDRLGSVPDRSGLDIRSARSIRVESDPPMPLQFDGEVMTASTPFEARVLPSAASFIVTNGGEKTAGRERAEATPEGEETQPAPRQ
jgi:diacylglycerol kinase family enzyme